MATTTTPADSNDGPVLTLINKRIRNLKKKLNRISQIEQSTVKNKEQEDLLKSKPSIVAAVDELEKLRPPLSAAVDEEIAIAVKLSQTPLTEFTETLGNVIAVTETETETETLGDNNNNNNNNNNSDIDNDDVNESDRVIEDLLKLIYIGNMFDVKTRSEYDSVMLTRTHERNCCLTYDYVTDDDAAVVLGESDLDLLAKMSSLLISRPVDLSASHQDALRRCVEHAKRWLKGAEESVEADSDVTYAALREKLTKIIGSDYLKITPEMKAPAVVAAEAAGNYVFQVPVQVENTVAPHEQTEDNSTDFQRNATHEDQSGPVEHSSEQEPEAENTIETQVQVEQGETNPANTENKEQYAPRRYNQRGGGRSNGGGRGGRGYGGGRGGRSGGRGGPYQNGRNQYYEQQGNYYQSNQRNYYGGRGRGGRGGGGGNGNGNGYNHHHGAGVEVAES
ncbi:uncharacterized protein LOC143616940 isoform X2 [Bidens hawaiensis]|uniref:uncharacterized protein LOC143616940 isoform X2 n=1 Tax=Bidens hawaiensis TaxID=980011 RepID=UPI00404A6BEC